MSLDRPCPNDSSEEKEVKNELKVCSQCERYRQALREILRRLTDLEAHLEVPA